MKGYFQRLNSLALISATFLLGACANSQSVDYNAVATNSAEATTSPLTQGAYTCPLNPNVMPVNDQNFNGTDEFTVCPDLSAPGQIMIHGETESSNQICVIPAESTASGVMANTSVTIQCPSISGNGVYVNYAGTTFNAVYIVEAQYSAQMLYCLKYGDDCPSSYSYGVIQ